MVDLINPDGRDTTSRVPQGPSHSIDGSLQVARHRAACVRLSDGTVLVTGGLQFKTGSVPETLNSAELFQPAGQ